MKWGRCSRQLGGSPEHSFHRRTGGEDSRVNCSGSLNIGYGSTAGLNVELQGGANLQSAAPASAPGRHQGRRPSTGSNDLIPTADSSVGRAPARSFPA